MLRPATPLSILFFAAFVLLLLSTLSTPVIRQIPLATFRGVNFGVLGYCNGTDCSGPMIGYDTGTLQGWARRWLKPRGVHSDVRHACVDCQKLTVVS